MIKVFHFPRERTVAVVGSRVSHWKYACLTPLVIVIFVYHSVQLEAVEPPALQSAPQGIVRNQAPNHVASIPLEKALLQVGSDKLQTRDFVTAVSFSPDGKLIAASGANSPTPTVMLFDVQSGKVQNRIALTDNLKGSIECLAFSPNQSYLLWGENTGFVAAWDLNTERLIWREKLHASRVSDIKISSDGRLLASCSEDGALHLRSVNDPSERVRTLEPGIQPDQNNPQGGFRVVGGTGIVSIAFSPDGTRLVAASEPTSTISVWQVQDGVLIRRIEKARPSSDSTQKGALRYVAVTPDGRRIITSGQRFVPIAETTLKYGAKTVNMSEVCIWDIESGELLKELSGADDHGFGNAALSPDGKRVAVSDCSLLRIINTDAGQPEHAIELPGSWGGPIAFSPDGSLIAMSINSSIALFDVASGKRMHWSDRTPEGGVLSGAWSPAGDRLIIGTGDGVVRVWDSSNGNLVWHKLLAPVISRTGWMAHPDFVGFSSDGHRIVVAGRRDDPVNYLNGIVSIYDARKGFLVRSVELKQIRHAALSADRKIIAVATSNGGIGDTRIIGIEFDTGQTLYTTPAKDIRVGFWKLNAMRFRSGSTDLLLSDGNGDIIELDGQTGTEKRRFIADFRTARNPQQPRKEQLQLWNSAFDANGKIMVTSSFDIITAWNVETGTLIGSFEHPHAHGCRIAVSPDGTTLATSDLQYSGDYGEDTIRIFDIQSGQQLMALDPQDNRAGVLEFSPDGTKLLTGFYRSSAIVWDVKRN